MKKRDQKRLDEALDKALAPPKQRPRQNLDALLEEYDDKSLSSFKSELSAGIPTSIPNTIPTGIPEGIPTIVSPKNTGSFDSDTTPPKVQRRRVQQASEEESAELTQEQSSPLDATHTSAEKVVYSIMYRETISKGASERHFGPAELMKRTGIRSRNTIHKALYGLIEKLSIEVSDESRGNPLGPRYRVYKPQVIEQRRKSAGIKIDQQSKKIVERGSVPAGIPVGIPDISARYPKNWDTTIPEIGIPTIPNFGIVIKNKESLNIETHSATASSSNSYAPTGADDEAFAALVENFKQAAKEITGREPLASEAGRWRELSELLVTELKIAAARTGSISSVPAFLTEHLRRRLWKKEQREVEGEAAEKNGAPAKAIDATKCPDCGGSGFYYPQGYENGVARCGHEKLREPD